MPLPPAPSILFLFGKRKIKQSHHAKEENLWCNLRAVMSRDMAMQQMSFGEAMMDVETSAPVCLPMD
jgi:hypothetical protein